MPPVSSLEDDTGLKERQVIMQYNLLLEVGTAMRSACIALGFLWSPKPPRSQNLWLQKPPRTETAQPLQATSFPEFCPHGENALPPVQS